MSLVAITSGDRPVCRLTIRPGRRPQRGGTCWSIGNPEFQRSCKLSLSRWRGRAPQAKTIVGTRRWVRRGAAFHAEQRVRWRPGRARRDLSVNEHSACLFAGGRGSSRKLTPTLQPTRPLSGRNAAAAGKCPSPWSVHSGGPSRLDRRAQASTWLTEECFQSCCAQRMVRLSVPATARGTGWVSGTATNAEQANCRGRRLRPLLRRDLARRAGSIVCAAPRGLRVRPRGPRCARGSSSSAT